MTVPLFLAIFFPLIFVAAYSQEGKHEDALTVSFKMPSLSPQQQMRIPVYRAD